MAALAWPGPTALVLVLIVGIWAVIAGIVQIAAAFAAGGTSVRPGQAGATRLARHPGRAGRRVFHRRRRADRAQRGGGGLLGLLRLRERHPERVDETSVDRLAEACLRLLGVPGPEAARLVASPLPPGGAVSR